MSRPARFSDEVVAQALANATTSKSVRELRSAQAVILSARHGLTMEQTAEVLGISRASVGLMQQAARTPQPPRRNPHGGRRRELMSLEEEKEFLASWAEHAATAGMIIVPPLHADLEEKLGRRVHHSQVYRMLARHGWRKLAPDSKHPKSDSDIQDAWKKNSRRWWRNASAGRQHKESDLA